MAGCVGGGHDGHASREGRAKTANIAVAEHGGFIDAQELCCVFWTSVSDMHSEEACSLRAAARHLRQSRDQRSAISTQYSVRTRAPEAFTCLIGTVLRHGTIRLIAMRTGTVIHSENHGHFRGLR
jgi:hypothetical protein